MNQTFVMCKPDAVERGLVGEIVGRLERKGFTLVAAELRTADKALAEEHYAEHVDKPFYGELVSFLTRSPVFAMIVEGPADNTYSLIRKVVGATKVDDAEPGTIRGDLATTTGENLVHASDGHEAASREIKLSVPCVAAPSGLKDALRAPGFADPGVICGAAPPGGSAALLPGFADPGVMVGCCSAWRLRSLTPAGDAAQPPGGAARDAGTDGRMAMELLQFCYSL